MGGKILKLRSEELLELGEARGEARGGKLVEKQKADLKANAKKDSMQFKI